jgi:hypothetical protein
MPAALHRVVVAKRMHLPATAVPGATALHAWFHEQYLAFVALLLKTLAGASDPGQAPALRILLDCARHVSLGAHPQAARQAAQLAERVFRAALSDKHEHVRAPLPRFA